MKKRKPARRVAKDSSGVLAAYEANGARLTRWRTRLVRAVNTVRKLEQEQRRLERKLGFLESIGG